MSVANDFILANEISQMVEKSLMSDHFLFDLADLEPVRLKVRSTSILLSFRSADFTRELLAFTAAFTPYHQDIATHK